MNVEEILSEFNIKNTKKPEYFSVLCPFHNDTNPSGSVHKSTGFFVCHVCLKKATLAAYLTKCTNFPLAHVKAKIGYRTDGALPIATTDIELDHVRIWEYPKFIEELHHRCITDDLIRKYRLGAKNGNGETRISIPIQNDDGEYANLRLYIPGATERKFLNTMGRGRSKTRLYPIEQLEYDTVLICGGELKAVAAAAVLNKYDIGAIAPTCGENDWPSEYNERFKGKLVYVNLDVDATGEKYSELRCRSLHTVARAVHKVVFTPEMVGNLPKGDINDFLRLGGDLYKLICETPEWVLVPGGELPKEDATEVEFRDAYSHDNVGKKLKFKAIVSGINSNSYLAPAVVEVKCNRNEEFCSICDVNSQAMIAQSDLTTLGTEMRIGSEHPALLDIIGDKTEHHWKIYKQCFKIPLNCRQCQFEVKKSYSLTEVRLDEQVDPSSRIDPLTMKAAYVVNSPVSIDPQTYNIAGRLYPSPKNQVSTFLVSDLEPTADALDAHISDSVETLYMFQPKEWTADSIKEKLDEIYSDFEANITKIYFRRDYHLLVDLVYHSVLHFKLGNTKNVNGWLEALVIGDTSQGKSDVSKLLQAHYGLGHKVDCGNVTLPGLTIGLEKGTNKHFAVYGAMPRNDKRLLIFEELKKLDPRIFQNLTEVRSSGTVQITKIDHKIRRARVRLLAISNCMDKREVSSYAYGIESALGVIGTNEDLRRFDITMIIAKFDIDPEELANVLRSPPEVEHNYTGDICQKLILKAWKCEDVVFQDVEAILSSTKRLLSIFGDGTPVLDPNSSHIKVAKMSAALAARTCSYEGDTLIVRKCHTDFIETFLTRIYSSPSCKLDAKSRAVRNATMLRDKEGLLRYLKSINNAADVMLKLIETDEITGRFIQELCGDFYIGSTLFARLIQSNAITKIRGDKYSKTAEFTKLLTFNKFEMDVPDYIRKEQF